MHVHVQTLLTYLTQAHHLPTFYWKTSNMFIMPTRFIWSIFVSNSFVYETVRIKSKTISQFLSRMILFWAGKKPSQSIHADQRQCIFLAKNHIGVGKVLPWRSTCPSLYQMENTKKIHSLIYISILPVWDLHFIECSMMGVIKIDTYWSRWLRYLLLLCCGDIFNYFL